MGIQINQYPLTATTINDDDFFDLDQWNGSAFESKKIKGSTLKNAVVPGLFTQTSDVTVTATTTESTLIGSGVGSLIVPANSFNVGDTFRLTVKGIISAHNNDTFTFKLKSGAVILATSGAITMPTVTAKVFEITSDFVIHSIGGVGVAEIVTAGSFCYNKDSSNAFEGQDFLTTNNSTFDTTIGNTLNLTVQFSSTNVNNSMNTKIVILEKTY